MLGILKSGCLCVKSGQSLLFFNLKWQNCPREYFPHLTSWECTEFLYSRVISANWNLEYVSILSACLPACLYVCRLSLLFCFVTSSLPFSFSDIGHWFGTKTLEPDHHGSCVISSFSNWATLVSLLNYIWFPFTYLYNRNVCTSSHSGVRHVTTFTSGRSSFSTVHTHSPSELFILFFCKTGSLPLLHTTFVAVKLVVYKNVTEAWLQGDAQETLVLSSQPYSCSIHYLLLTSYVSILRSFLWQLLSQVAFNSLNLDRNHGRQVLFTQGKAGLQRRGSHQ